MSDPQTPKMQLIAALQNKEITPNDAVKAFEALPKEAQKNGRVYQSRTLDERREQYRKARAVRAAIRRDRQPFISRHFLPNFFLSQGLIVVGAESGRAKSTTCSNVLHGFLVSDMVRTAIVISNEEATDAVYERTACIGLKLDYRDFFTGNVTAAQERAVLDYIETKIIPRVEVVEEGNYDMSYIEDVQAVLNSAPTTRVGLVLIDYLQIITQSREKPNAETFEISKRLGIFLKDFGKTHGIPVVCFAQLHSTARGPTMAERIQNDKTFFNHGFACIEIVPDFETTTTTFKVHKDRFFGHTGKEVVCDFTGGRYVFQGEESL